MQTNPASAPTPPATRRAPGPPPAWMPLASGLALTAAGVAASFALSKLVTGVGVLTWAVILGALLANLGLIPTTAGQGIKKMTKKVLRIGVVLLGFSLSLVTIASLGGWLILAVVVTVLLTLAVTWWAGLKMGLAPAQSLLIATGFSICGASAIAAMEDNARADEDDVAISIAMVTVWGLVAMISIPLLQGVLGLSDQQLGIWAGAAVHEVGQVVAAASPAGQVAIGVAVLVKLTRVLMLAPIVAGVSAWRRRQATHAEHPVSAASLPPLVPMFVAGFIVAVLIRSTGIIPDAALTWISYAQTAALGAAMFGLGCGTHIKAIVKNGGPALLLGALSTVVIAVFSLGWVNVLA